MGILSLAEELTPPWASRRQTRSRVSNSLELVRGTARFWAHAVRGARNSNLVKGGDKMKPSIKNEVAGNVHEVKGKVKEKAGQLTNNPDLEAEGQAEKIGGKLQKKIGQVEKTLGK